MSSRVDSDDLHALAAAQRRELMEARGVDSDYDIAFDIQLEEAIKASLSLQPSTSISTTTLPPPPPRNPYSSSSPDDVVLKFADVQTEELLKFEQEIDDRKFSEIEFRRMRDDLQRRIHDQKVAQEILHMPEDEWEEFGDNFERPYGEGTSKSENNEVFRVYFKGIVEKCSAKVAFGGIGVAICDSSDELLFEMRKPLSGSEMSRQCMEIKALIEGLNAAIALDLKRIIIFTDYRPVFQYVTGRWSAKQPKIVSLINQVALLRQKFSFCQPSFVARNEIKFAFKFAREAMVSHIKKLAESTTSRSVYETCVICLEDTDIAQIFSVDSCMHRYCISCMKQHVEVKLRHGMVPECPHEGCNSVLKLDSCSKFLTPKFIDIMKQRMKEASIPIAEKVYCPYPRCSALMSKSEVFVYSRSALAGLERSGARKCTKCNGYFCINCKVPWHTSMTCSHYKRINPNPPEDVKLKNLAARNLWRQCVKCNHMIELAAGCYHMTCRCGYEFCYTCGAGWKDKKATCACKLWDEGNIIDSTDEDAFDEEFDDDDYYDSDSSDDYY